MSPIRFALAMLVLSIGCKTRLTPGEIESTSESRAHLSPNDIAILFRLPEVTTSEGNLKDLLRNWLIPAIDDEHPIIPKNTISGMLSDFSWPANTDVRPIRDSLSQENLWYMTSLRAGCTNVRIVGSNDCRITLRVVLQPVQWSFKILTFPTSNNRAPLDGRRTHSEDPAPIPSNWISTEDAAIHLIYAPTGNRGHLLLKSMLSLSTMLKTRYAIDTFNYRLGVHPAFEPGRLSDEQKKEFFVEIRKVLEEYAQLGELHSAEVMLTSGVRRQAPLPITWTFETFRRGADNRLKPVPIGRGIKPHAAGDVVFAQSLSFTDGYIPGLKTKENSFFDIVKNWRTVDARADTASTASLERDFKNINSVAAYVDDPRNLSILMGDCVTCHVSSTLRNVSMHGRAKKAISSIQDLDERVHRYKKVLFSEYPSSLSSEVEALAEISVVPVIPEYNLHQFSYFLHAPSVSKRAANDIAFDVLFFNQILESAK